MMDQITRLKKSNTFISTLVLVGVLFSQAVLASETLPKLPVIQQVGVIPVNSEQESDDSEVIRAKLDAVFPAVIRNAKRFRVLNDDLVRSTWHTQKGRDELRSQFELHAFAALTMIPRGSTTTLAMRLLNPDLKTYIIEMEQYPTNWLRMAHRAEIQEKIESLVFRLINRIPVDVSITSIQGSYITLSGGSEQGVEAGDKVELVRSSIKSLHPATGSWNDFHSLPLGSASIIEVKNYSSVAKIESLVFDGGVEIGDGAKIPAIAGRSKFARAGKIDGFEKSPPQDTIIVPPLYQGEAPKVKLPPVPFAGNPDQSAKPGQPGESAPPTAAQPQEEAAAQPTQASDDGSIWDDFNLDGFTQKIVDDVEVAIGPKWWNTKGRSGVGASGNFPLWLVNHIYVTVNRTLFYKIRVSFGGGAGFGGTSNGRYFSYDSHARIFWENQIVPGSFFGYWRAGGHGKFSGLSVEDESFGGGDFIRGGGFGGLGGTLYLGAEQERYDWFSEFAVLPLNIGRFGYLGDQHRVESTFGWELKLGAYQTAHGSPLNFGGQFRYFTENMTLADDSRPQINEFNLEFLAKYSF